MDMVASLTEQDTKGIFIALPKTLSSEICFIFTGFWAIVNRLAVYLTFGKLLVGRFKTDFGLIDYRKFQPLNELSELRMWMTIVRKHSLMRQTEIELPIKQHPDSHHFCLNSSRQAWKPITNINWALSKQYFLMQRLQLLARFLILAKS